MPKLDDSVQDIQPVNARCHVIALE